MTKKSTVLAALLLSAALALAGCRAREGTGESPQPALAAPQPPAPSPGPAALPAPTPSVPSGALPGVPPQGLPAQGAAGDITDEQVAAIRQALMCNVPAHARYCTAVDLFSAGAPLPPGPGLRYGTAMYMEVPVGGAVRRTEEACFLVTGPRTAEFAYVIPEDDTERAQVAAFVATVRQGLPAPVGDPVLAFVRSRAGTARNPAATAGRSTVFGGARGDRVYARQAGATLAVLEVVQPQGSTPLCYRVGVLQH